ncbi:drug resistance transporter, EmrB/QacA subfamily [Geodermatophilus aquaeductus]|uniref:Drug resistance transporter, EmrB/QacA subfamily n=1 Tax=Geodermatophilus aquaeductus TaxID=1564161 RepID=A0A521E8W2_9ACTN|nr:drug resistance transporter, EmrB/QacA subfamily [Geodermatophilus aquaeductus]
MAPGTRSSASAVTGPEPGGRTAAVVAVLAIAVFMSSLDLFIVNLAFPSIGEEYPEADLSSLSWVLNAYTIVFAAVLVPAGRWADRVGRRRALVAGLAVFTAGSLLCGLAPGVGWLVAARTVQAVGAGVMVPASLSLLLAVVPQDRRARALGSWSALGALGAALGPVIGGALVEIGWRWVFWVNLPVGVVAILLTVRLVPESRDEARGSRPDLLGALFLALAVGLVAGALVEAADRGWASGAVLGLLLASVLCAAAVVVRSRRHPAPVLEPALFRSRAFSGAGAASVLYYAAFGAFLLNTVEFLTGVWRFTPLEAGLAIAPGPLMVLPFARLVAPRLIPLLGGVGRVAALGCGVGALAQVLWLVLLQTEPAYATHLLPAQLLGGAGVGLAIPSLLGAGSAGLPMASLGTGSGILNTARQVGTVLGVAALVAALAVPGPDPLTVFRHGIALTIAFFVAAGVVCVAVLARRSPPAAAVAAPLPAPPAAGAA